MRQTVVLWMHGHCIVWLYWNCDEFCVIRNVIYKHPSYHQFLLPCTLSIGWNVFQKVVLHCFSGKMRHIIWRFCFWSVDQLPRLYEMNDFRCIYSPADSLLELLHLQVSTHEKLRTNEFIFMKFDIGVLKFINALQFWLKLNRHNGHFAWRPTCVSVYISNIIL